MLHNILGFQQRQVAYGLLRELKQLREIHVQERAPTQYMFSCGNIRQGGGY